MSLQVVLYNFDLEKLDAAMRDVSTWSGMTPFPFWWGTTGFR